MKKEKLPLIYYWISGAIGKRPGGFVIKQYKYGPVKTKYPDMTKIIASKSQRKCRDLFKEAVTYAQSVMADPKQKAEWQKRIRHKNRVFVRVVRFYILEAKQAMIRKQQAVEKLIRSCFTKEKRTLQANTSEKKTTSANLNKSYIRHHQILPPTSYLLPPTSYLLFPTSCFHLSNLRYMNATSRLHFIAGGRRC